MKKYILMLQIFIAASVDGVTQSFLIGGGYSRTGFQTAEKVFLGRIF